MSQLGNFLASWHYSLAIQIFELRVETEVDRRWDDFGEQLEAQRCLWGPAAGME